MPKFYPGDQILYKDKESGECYHATYLNPWNTNDICSNILLNDKYRLTVPTAHLLPRSAEVFLDPSKIKTEAPDVSQFVKAAMEKEKSDERKEAAGVLTGYFSGADPAIQQIPKTP